MVHSGQDSVFKLVMVMVSRLKEIFKSEFPSTSDTHTATVSFLLFSLAFHGYNVLGDACKMELKPQHSSLYLLGCHKTFSMTTTSPNMTTSSCSTFFWVSSFTVGFVTSTVHTVPLTKAPI